jgi:hypothetical protein
VPSTALPNRQIAPDIGIERTYLLSYLQATGLITTSRAGSAGGIVRKRRQAEGTLVFISYRGK